MKAKMSPNIANTSNTTVSPNSSKNSTKSPFVLDSLKVLPTANPVEVANDDINLHPSVRDFVPACPSNNQSENSACMITRQIKYDGNKEGCIFSAPELPNRLPRSNLQNALFSTTTFKPNRSSSSVLSDHGTLSKWLRKCWQGCTFYHYDLLGSQSKAPRFHIVLSLAGPIRGISYLILIDSYLKWPKVTPTKSATTDGVINSLSRYSPITLEQNLFRPEMSSTSLLLVLRILL
ncbi:unnamed protein product [Hymenolepis diminuta]|uniref:Uncharacterized protein n=1 Tax=Hymenolepis diminuta TaxID=6216 RepID=A0A564YIR1_HYMDI|nr:unnamed protein product [Hymenolepis diminuta]